MNQSKTTESDRVCVCVGGHVVDKVQRRSFEEILEQRTQPSERIS